MFDIFFNYRHLLVSLTYGTVFYDLKSDEATERQALFFFSIMFFCMGHMQAIPAMFEDRLLYSREKGAQAYGAVPYWVSSFFFQLPLICINILIFASVVYPLSGLRSDPGCFGIYVLVNALVSITGFFNCQLLACLAPSAQIAVQFFPIAFFFTTTFAGYVVYIPTFPEWLKQWVFFNSMFHFPVLPYFRFLLFDIGSVHFLHSFRLSGADIKRI